MYFGRYLGSIVRNILGEMADHHNMVSKATLQSLSQGFPSFDNRIDSELYNVVQHYNTSFKYDRLQAIYFVSSTNQCGLHQTQNPVWAYNLGVPKSQSRGGRHGTSSRIV